MKRNLKKMLTASALAVTMMATLLPVSAFATSPTEEKKGDGAYSITVQNNADTGISIAGDWFHAYQIFTADDITTYAVDEDFIGFFTGEMTGGDGKTYDFGALEDAIETAEAAFNDLAGDATDADKANAQYEVDTAWDDYNQLAGLYVESYQSDLYDLAVALRAYIEADADYTDNIKCSAHNQVDEDSETYPQTVTLSGLEAGYYFVLDEESTNDGLGIAASGAFVPVGENTATHQTITVKSNTPTVDKKILHNDLSGSEGVQSGTENGKWDIVGDYQIGDTAYFMITSTLPNNIADYNFDASGNKVTEGDDESTYTSYDYEDYYYVLTDTMSAGITYDENVGIYLDEDATTALDSQYWKVLESDDVTNGFVVQVNVKGMLHDPKYYSIDSDGNITYDYLTLYTHYTGTVTEDALVAKDYETNTIHLEFNSNPDDSADTGEGEATVYSYTFDLEITKMDESGNGLAGATFALYEGNYNNQLPLVYEKTVGEVDYYYIDPDMTVDEENTGYIVTNAEGEFVILGLDDATTYIFSEVQAPDGYNAIDPIQFTIYAEYNAAGELIILTGDNSLMGASGDLSGGEADIINRKTVFLPATGGMGTVAFQVGGGALMCAAAGYLLLSRKKKSHRGN